MIAGAQPGKLHSTQSRDTNGATQVGLYTGGCQKSTLTITHTAYKGYLQNVAAAQQKKWKSKNVEIAEIKWVCHHSSPDIL